MVSSDYDGMNERPTLARRRPPATRSLARAAIPPAASRRSAVLSGAPRRRQDLRRQDLVDQMGAADVGKVRALFVGGQPGADALRHQQHQRAVAEPQPIAAPDELVLAVARERVFLKAIERRAVEA